MTSHAISNVIRTFLRVILALASAWGIFDSVMRFYVWWNQRQFGPDVFRDAGPAIDYFFSSVLYGVPLALAGFVTSMVLSHRKTHR